MREVCVIGVGMTKFAKFPEIDVLELGREASWNAIKDAGINPKEIETAYCGSARTGQLLRRECGVGQEILGQLGITGIPIASVGNFCASGSTAFREAWMAVGSGLYDMAMAIGVEKLTGRAGKGRPLTSDNVFTLTALGFTPPSIYANVANRHMHQYGTTLEQFAKVAVKNRKNACFNPYAQYRKEVTVEEVLSSPMIVEPLTLFSCCPTSDGAAAAILCSKEKAKKYTTKPVMVAASAQNSAIYVKGKDITTFPADLEASKTAYEMAGIGPEDIDVAEVHDCFTVAEIIHYEDMGFCERGEGGRMLDEGETEIGGKVAVNPSGGLMSQGHPLGATGVRQICEIVWQLRGEAGERQQEGAKVGMTHCGGGVRDSIEILVDGGCINIHILKRGW